MDSPLITIGVITHNRRQWLRRAIDSALSQLGPVDFEVVVCDDGSTDNTVQCLDEIASAHSHVRVIRHCTNRGRPAARNSVVKGMRGNYLIWLDDDDVLTPDCLRAQCAFASAHPSADIVYGNLWFCDSELRTIRVAHGEAVAPHLVANRLLFHNFVPNIGTLIKRQLLEAMAPYDGAYPRGQDYDFWARAACAGARFAFNNVFAAHYWERRACVGEDAVPGRVFQQINSRVTQYLARSLPLSILFPMYSWSTTTRQPKSLSLATIALILMWNGDVESARQFAKSSQEYCDNAVARSILAGSFVLGEIWQTTVTEGLLEVWRRLLLQGLEPWA